MHRRPARPSAVHARLAWIAPLALALMGTGCGGGGGAPLPEPSITSVSPSTLWRDDTLTLAITTADTAWSAAAPPKVVADTDLEIGTVTVDGPTALRVTVHVKYDAVVGVRPIYVNVDGGGSLYAVSPGVEVKAPIVASWFSQPFVRSSILVGSVYSNRVGDVLDAPVQAISQSGDALPLYLDDPHGFMVVVPENAPLGQFDLYVHRTGTDGASTVRVPGGFISPRTTVLTSFPQQVSLPTSEGTALHRYTATTACYLEFPLSSPDPTLPIQFLYAHESPYAPPVVGLAPVLHASAGTGPRSVALAGETFDVIVFAGHATYTLGVSEAPSPVVAEAEPNDSFASAQPLTLPVIVSPASVDTGASVDVYSFAVTAGDVGKVVRVVGAPGASLGVSVLRADRASILGAGSATGPGASIDLKSRPLPAAETIFVRVQSAASATTPDPTNAYRMFIRLEAP